MERASLVVRPKVHTVRTQYLKRRPEVIYTILGADPMVGYDIIGESTATCNCGNPDQHGGIKI